MTLITVFKERRVHKVVCRPTVHQAAVPKLCIVRKTELGPRESCSYEEESAYEAH